MEAIEKLTFISGALAIVMIVIDVFFNKYNLEIFNVKPITYFIVFAFVFFACFCELIVARRLYWAENKQWNRIAVIIGFALVMIFLFELLWSFFFWFSTYQLNVIRNDLIDSTQTLDTLNYNRSSYDYEQYFRMVVWEPNLNHSAKKNVLLFACSLYFLYVALRVDGVKH